MAASVSNPSKNSKVHFFFQATRFNLANRTRLKNYIEFVFKNEGRRLESLNFIFCTDKTLLEINQRFLKHDFYTDIITFDLSQTSSITAEIYISVPRVKDNSGKLGISFKSEIHRVIFHGILHLCGFNDKKRIDREQMRKREEDYLHHYFK